MRARPTDRRLALALLAAAPLGALACSPADSDPTTMTADAGASPSSATVGPAGGTIAVGGVQIVVPAGATVGDLDVRVVDMGDVPAGVLSQHERAIGHRLEIELRTKAGGPARLSAPDADHPVTLSISVPGGAIAAGESAHALLALPGRGARALLLDEAEAGASAVPARLFEVPSVVQLAVVASEPWTGTAAQSLARGPGLSPQGAGDSEAWGATGFDVRVPGWFLWDDAKKRAEEWMPKAAHALASLGLREPRLGRTKDGRWLVVLTAADDAPGLKDNHFDFGATDLVDAPLVDSFGSVAGTIYLQAEEMQPDEDGVDHPGFAPSSCAHELYHSISARYGVRVPIVDPALTGAVVAGAVPLPLDLGVPPMPGVGYFPQRGFEEGVAALVGHAVVEGDALAPDLLRGDTRALRLDRPLAIGNATGAGEQDMSRVYGAVDFFAWLARRHGGGTLELLPTLLDFWATGSSANYGPVAGAPKSPGMNDLHAWFPGGPPTLAEAYVDFVVQRAFLRDDEVGGVVASRLRGASKRDPKLADDSRHQVIEGLWESPPATLLASSSLDAIVPFSARGLRVPGAAAGDLKLSVKLTGDAPAGDVRVVAMQAKGDAAVVKPVEGAAVIGEIGLDPQRETFVVVANVSTSGASAGVAVEVAPVSDVPYGKPGQSCGAGLDCGGGVSCCESALVPGGSFPMGRSVEPGGSDAVPNLPVEVPEELPEHLVTVADFRLDLFEVTVGRFRAFVDAFDGTQPPVGAGAHPLIPGSGWQAEWSQMHPSKADIVQRLKNGGATWTDAPGANEARPINNVDWYLAAAFCAWDGGRLPTEAEWEYAAAGGDENRLYPWGSAAPDATRALYGCDACSPAPVGSTPAGNGRWGHRDLAGNLWEWTLDAFDPAFYAGAGGSCSSCANLAFVEKRANRGGGYTEFGGPFYLRAAARIGDPAWSGGPDYGFRCARSP